MHPKFQNAVGTLILYDFAQSCMSSETQWSCAPTTLLQPRIGNFFIVFSLCPDLSKKMTSYGHYVSCTLVTDKQTGISAECVQMILVFIIFIRSDHLGSVFFIPGNQLGDFIEYILCLNKKIVEK